MSATAISFEQDVPDEHELELRLGRITQTHPWLIAEQNGEVIGYAYGSPHRERAAYRWATDVTVYVSPDHHGRGVGRGLYEALISQLADQGFQVACAGITLPNEGSVALHRALGFTEVGVYRRIGFKFGAWHDVAWWQRELRPAEGQPAGPGPPARAEDGR